TGHHAVARDARRQDRVLGWQRCGIGRAADFAGEGSARRLQEADRLPAAAVERRARKGSDRLQPDAARPRHSERDREAAIELRISDCGLRIGGAACALAVMAGADALAAQPPRELRWAGDPEGGAPFVEAGPARPELVIGFDV